MLEQSHANKNTGMIAAVHMPREKPKTEKNLGHTNPKLSPIGRIGQLFLKALLETTKSPRVDMIIPGKTKRKLPI